MLRLEERHLALAARAPTRAVSLEPAAFEQRGGVEAHDRGRALGPDADPVEAAHLGHVGDEVDDPSFGHRAGERIIAP